MKTKNKVTILLPTYDRYTTTLPLCLMSIVNQSYLPDRVVLIDDSPQKRFYEHETLKNILYLFKQYGIEFDYFYGESKGVVPALQIGLDNIEDGWVLKMDDDNILPYNTIELFVKNIKPNIGAMGGVVVDHFFIKYQKNNPDKISTEIDGYYNRIENIYTELNIQMMVEQSPEIKQVQHLYSNYFFNRKLADDYPMELQPSGHREETIFTYSIFRKGYDIIVIPQIKMQHLSFDDNTGDKQYKDKRKNEEYFIERLKEWGIIPDKIKPVEKEGKLVLERNGMIFKVL